MGRLHGRGSPAICRLRSRHRRTGLDSQVNRSHPGLCPTSPRQFTPVLAWLRYLRGPEWSSMGARTRLGSSSMAAVIRMSRSASAPSPELEERCLELVDALTRTQRDSGLWTIVLDQPETYEETTLAAMFVPAIGELRRAGIVISEPAIAASTKARAAVRRHTDASGVLQLVSSATPGRAASHLCDAPIWAVSLGPGRVAADGMRGAASSSGAAGASVISPLYCGQHALGSTLTNHGRGHSAAWPSSTTWSWSPI